MNLDHRIELLKAELERLETRKQAGALTFEEWIRGLDYPVEFPVVPVGTYGASEVGREVSWRRDAAGPDFEFLPGERPVVMRGAYWNMTNGGDYQSVQFYVSKVLSRYMWKIDKPTIFFYKDWQEYWSGLVGRYWVNRRGSGKGSRPVRYMGRRSPYLCDGKSPFDRDIGIDTPWPTFIIRGKVFEVGGLRSESQVKERVQMLTQFARQAEKLEALDRKIAALH